MMESEALTLILWVGVILLPLIVLTLFGLWLWNRLHRLDEEDAKHGVWKTTDEPGFFSPPCIPHLGRARVLDRRSATQGFEEYIKEENDCVAAFLSNPTVELLYHGTLAE